MAFISGMPCTAGRLENSGQFWRPNVLVIDEPGRSDGDSPVDSLVAEAVVEAYKQAGDPKAFPEQITQLGLKPWTPAKLYIPCADQAQAQIVIDAGEILPRLED